MSLPLEAIFERLPDYVLSIFILYYIGKKIDKLNDALLNHLKEIKDKLD